MDLLELLDGVGRVVRQGIRAERQMAVRDMAQEVVKEAIMIAGNRVPTEGELATAAIRLEAELRQLSAKLTNKINAAYASGHERAVRDYWTQAHLSGLPEPKRERVAALLESFTSDGRKTLSEAVDRVLFDGEDTIVQWNDFLNAMRTFSVEKFPEIRRACEREALAEVELNEYVRQSAQAVIDHPEWMRSVQGEVSDLLRGLTGARKELRLSDAYRLVGGNGRTFKHVQLVKRAQQEEFIVESKEEFTFRRALLNLSRSPAEEGERARLLLFNAEIYALGRTNSYTTHAVRFFSELGVDPRTDAQVVHWTGMQGMKGHWYLYPAADGTTVMIVRHKHDPRFDAVWVFEGDSQEALSHLSERYRSPQRGVKSPPAASSEVPRSLADALGARSQIDEHDQMQASLQAASSA